MYAWENHFLNNVLTDPVTKGTSVLLQDHNNIKQFIKLLVDVQSVDYQC